MSRALLAQPLCMDIAVLHWENIRSIAGDTLVAAVDGCGTIIRQRHVFWVLLCMVEAAHHLARPVHLWVCTPTILSSPHNNHAHSDM
jgi:hypothetical protein